MECGNEHANMLTSSVEMISWKNETSFSLIKFIVKSPMSIYFGPIFINNWKVFILPAGLDSNSNDNKNWQM